MDEKQKKKILREIKDLTKLKKKFQKKAQTLLDRGDGMRCADSARLAVKQARTIGADIERLQDKLDGKDSKAAKTKKTHENYHGLTERESRELDEYRQWLRENNVSILTIFDTKEEIAQKLEGLPEHLREIAKKIPDGRPPRAIKPDDCDASIFTERVIEI